MTESARRGINVSWAQRAPPSRDILEGQNGTANSIRVMEEPLHEGSQDARSLTGRLLPN